MHDYDAIIIGAGLSGLAAGIRLAYYDQRVCILERHTTIGGLNSFYRLDGRNYDVGLHAVTNFSPKGTRRGPLPRLLRQLRLAWDEFELVPQVGSRIAFPGVSLDFTNDFRLLEAEVARAFPSQKDNFQRLLGLVVDYDDLDFSKAAGSAREFVESVITDPLLVDMLLCPLMYYGSAREDDLDFAQFCILFRSIFCEGLARPHSGVRVILKTLVRRYKALGGVLRLKSGVRRLAVEGGRVAAIELEDGSSLTANKVLSSAGWLETLRLCDDVSREEAARPGQLTFCETMAILDRQPRELGLDRTVIFFNHGERFVYRKPEALVDDRSGVLCSPNNFLYDEALAEGVVRVTVLANYDGWAALPEPDYRREKLRWFDRIIASAVRFTPDFRGSVVATDMFTPTTIRRFTGHENGAVYGSPEKKYDGRTHLANLFVCGTDQGLVGIIGAMTSGIAIANRHLLPQGVEPGP